MSDFVRAIASVLWPAIVIGGVCYFRSHIRLVLDALRIQLASGAVFKWREFELRGVNLRSFDDKHGDAIRVEAADKTLFESRHQSYRANKNLFLVHRVRANGQVNEKNAQPMYDVLIYLLSHKNFGHLNDIKEVEYYLGQYFGRQRGAYGTKYIVQNGSEGFAVRLDAYGPSLCEARIKFHDGSETTVSRYLDFEGTGYRFNASVVESGKQHATEVASLTSPPAAT